MLPQVFEGLTIQRHLHLTSFLLLLHEKMLYDDKPFVPDAIDTTVLVLSEYCLLLNFYNALPDDFPKIARIDPIFQ